MRIFFGLFGFIGFAFLIITRIILGIQFDQNCGGYIERSANANTIQLAVASLATATTYLDEHNIRSGYTSILYKTPDEDVGYWSQNLHAALDELKAVKPETTQLERTNILLKLRETLTAQDGAQTIIPKGISIHGNNKEYFWAMMIFMFIMIICLGPKTFEEI